MRKLITLAATGALLAMMVPAAALAADPPTECVKTSCDSPVTLTVDEGTTIWAPAAIVINHAAGAAFPGRQVISSAITVGYLSNEDTKGLVADIEADSDPLIALCLEGTPGSGVCTAGEQLGITNEIDKEDVFITANPFGSGDMSMYLDGGTAILVPSLAATGSEWITSPGDFDNTDHAYDTTTFKIGVDVPSVEAGTYVGTLTFSAVTN